MTFTRTVCIFAALLSSGISEDKKVPEGAVAAEEKRHEIRYLQGWTVHVNRDLMATFPKETTKALELLGIQLTQINKVVPPKALVVLHGVPLWLNPKYAAVDVAKAEYHPSAGWLKEHGRDPRMAKAVEFTNVLIFEKEVSRMPLFVLHELAHAYHDSVLDFKNEELIKAFENARSSGVYDSVDRWSGTAMSKAKAYALSNVREYFAENSEAFFGRNDFQPFDRQELKAMDPKMHELLAKLWGAM